MKMQKQVLLKFLSGIPTRLKNSSFLESHFCKSFVSVAERKSKQLFNPSITKPHLLLLSQLNINSYRSCLSQHGLSEKITGFLANPAFLRKLVSNTHLKNRSRNIFDRGVCFMRVQYQKRHFKIDRTFNSLQRHRWISWNPTVDGVVMGLIAANAAVFFLWRIADPTFMRKNFMISVENFKSGRVHTLITSAFSHMEIEHLVSNMIGLYFFGENIGRTFGPQFLLKLYLAGALAGSIFYLLHHAFMTPPKSQGGWYVDTSRIPGLGASGAVNAIMLLDIFLFPKATVYAQFFIPVPAILLGAFLIGKDILRILEGDSQISGSAHLGGAVVAAITWARVRKRWI